MEDIHVFTENSIIRYDNVLPTQTHTHTHNRLTVFVVETLCLHHSRQHHHCNSSIRRKHWELTLNSKDVLWGEVLWSRIWSDTRTQNPEWTRTERVNSAAVLILWMTGAEQTPKHRNKRPPNPHPHDQHHPQPPFTGGGAFM